jgi:DNA-binding response OmpR family regulator
MRQPELIQAVDVALEPIQAEVRVAINAAEATALETWHPRLAIVDADEDNGQLLHSLVPRVGPPLGMAVMALTRGTELSWRLAILDAGADDVLVIPFVAEELTARARALLRRPFTESPDFNPVVRAGSIELDLMQARERFDGTELDLTATERRLLYFLVANTGRVLSRNEILDRVWSSEYEVESNVVDHHVARLRAKLGDSARRPRIIATVPRQGYRFLLPVAMPALLAISGVQGLAEELQDPPATEAGLSCLVAAGPRRRERRIRSEGKSGPRAPAIRIERFRDCPHPRLAARRTGL